jgi:hypothetical protein
MNTRALVLLLVLFLLSCKSEESPAPKESPEAEQGANSAPESTSMPSAEVLERQKSFIDALCACNDKACRDKVGLEIRATLPREDMVRTAKEFPVESGTLLARKRECAEEDQARSREVEAVLDATEATMAKLVNELCACPDLSCFDTLDAQLQDRITPANIKSFMQIRSKRAGKLAARHRECRDTLTPASAPPAVDKN